MKSHLLRELHWLPLVFRVQLKVLVIIYKALCGPWLSGYFKGCLPIHICAWALQSWDEGLSPDLTIEGSWVGGNQGQGLLGDGPLAFEFPPEGGPFSLLLLSFTA